MGVWSVWFVCLRRRQAQQIVPSLPFSSSPLSFLTLPFQMSAPQRDISHRIACACMCASAWRRENASEENHIKDLSCLLRSNVLALSVSFFLSHVASSNQWRWHCRRALSFGGKYSFPTEKDALEHSHRHNVHTHIHTWAPLNSERKRRLIENGFFWGREWKDQVSLKSTKPRATLRAVRCQQLLFSLSLCFTHTNTHRHKLQ